MSQKFNFENLVALCRRTHDQTQRSAARAIDRSLVARNWLFGWYIVEYEQHGADRAEYGSQILNRVSSRLQQIGIKGSSITRLKLYRRFYQQQKGIGPTLSAQLASLAYGDGISATRPTVPDESISLPPAASHPLENAIALLEDQFPLSWSHYIILLSIDNPEERRPSRTDPTRRSQYLCVEIPTLPTIKARTRDPT